MNWRARGPRPVRCRPAPAALVAFHRAALSVALIAVAVLALTACTPGVGDHGAASTTGTAPTPSSGSDAGGAATAAVPAAVPSADLAAIQAAIASINATAGGPVAAQRAVLDRLAAPDQQAGQRACPAAHSTLAFQPAWADLRPAPPGWGEADSGDPPAGGPTTSSADAIEPAANGTAYLLPAFITIYTGDRISGTDMTTLHLWTLAGAAHTAALCVS